MDADRWGLVAATALVVALFGETMLWTLNRLFFLNFVPDGPTPTVILVLLLATGWICWPLARYSPEARTVAAGTVATLAVAIGATLGPSSLLAALTAIAALTACTALIVALAEALEGAVAIGLGGGIVLLVGVREGLNGITPYATTTGTLVLGGLVVTLGGVLVGLASRDGLPDPSWDALRTRPESLLGVLFLAPFYLAIPGALATTDLAVVALVAGVVTGIVLVTRSLEASHVTIAALAIPFGVLVLGMVDHPVALGAYAAVWTAVLVTVAGTATHGPAGPRARSLTIVQVACVAGLLLYMLAGSAGLLVDPIKALLRGTDDIVFALVHGIVTVAAIATLHGRVGTVRPVDLTRRSLVGSMAVAGLPLLALGRDTERTPPPDPDDDLRVLTLNLHMYAGAPGTMGYNLEAILEHIKAFQPDVLALQEAAAFSETSGNMDGLRWLLDDLGYHSSLDHVDERRAVVVLSRWPFASVRYVELPRGEWGSRVACEAIVKTPQGDVPVIGTHLMVPRQGDVRHEQATRLVELAQSHERAVVLGDFNVDASPTERAYRVLDDGLTDAWTAAAERVGGPETFPAGDPQRRIDHVWLYGAWSVPSVQVDGSRALSDHLTVGATLEPE